MDIDKDKVARKRYFECLAAFMLELDALSGMPFFGIYLRNLLKRYKVEIFADKKRCRINLEYPEGFKAGVLHKDLLKTYHKFKWKKRV